MRLKLDMIRKIKNRVKSITKTQIVKNNIEGKDNKIHYKNANLTQVSFDILGNNNSILIKDGARINKLMFFIRGDNHVIEIEENCLINHGGCFWFEDKNGYLRIGKNTTIESAHIAITEDNSSVNIGENCMLAHDIDIRTGDSHSIIDENTGKRTNLAKNIAIDNNVWIATRAILLKGIKLGQNSVVATGAIVTSANGEEGVIWAGNPARIVKHGISWSRERL